MSNKIKQQQRKILYFLGAGASYAAGATATVQRGGQIRIPTQARFWDTFLRFCSKHNEGVISSLLFRYFKNYKRVPARLTPGKRREALDGIDVEEVFTFLSERIRAPGTSVSLRTFAEKVWTALVSEMGPVFARFEANANTRAIYRALAKNQLRSRDTVVSFNYDTVFENSLPAKKRWHYEGINTRPHSLRILKPHGSSNWETDDDDGGIVIAKVPRRAIIVAPTHLKFIGSRYADAPRETVDTAGYLDQSTQIAEIWETMEKEMRLAKALVFIGYSFPISDLYFSSLLRSVLATRDAPQIILVNPDARAIQQRLHDRFALESVVPYFDLESFAFVDRAETLQRIEAFE